MASASILVLADVDSCRMDPVQRPEQAALSPKRGGLSPDQNGDKLYLGKNCRMDMVFLLFFKVR